eukprot:TRINITY_DN19770_c0_g1_i1.p2 TRINITY_DN19770_c0_g1~~TRINITY_DN19770_c0_g1_i1.p2  ORF type:complete len:127 (+),score=29.58 TRINITY_DN19770_c0_g1_i1:577-957(+)
MDLHLEAGPPRILLQALDHPCLAHEAEDWPGCLFGHRTESNNQLVYDSLVVIVVLLLLRLLLLRPLLLLLLLLLRLPLLLLLLLLLLLSLIHISEPTRLLSISYAVFCLKKKKNMKHRILSDCFSS